ncbi:hypothetical protein M5C72_04905 [Companilactobacillus allii]|uniref:Uncharacterized protein n=1 Tax=Companilactobacillus allii TaxID=1847728 RepID=A0A1P8Q3L9_9LACO|nr:hypothetical protein [Companilactobacillus allii]APX72462.1 hypothetical protein BTM29_07830 [Companilactobacillus allii]USQ69561.1 hypothetical protein M5C72_04905 [Companilactobacillus allii]
MMRSTEVLVEDIKKLGYETGFGSSNPDRPNQQLWVYKPSNSHPIAKVSLILNCRVNTMFNGVGKNETKLLKLLVKYSIRGK